MSERKKNKKVVKTIGVVGAVSAAAVVALAIKKLPESRYANNPEEQNPFEGKKVKFVYDDTDAQNADGVKGHLESEGELNYQNSFYDKYVKRALDVLISASGLIVLAPVFAGIAIAIQIDDPGSVMFCQKRVGKNKQYFKLHKFRSMKMSTPNNVPTHMLNNPQDYLTRVGKFLRAHSLDELPQAWDIFIGNMSFIGPRPGLWNQDLLTAERDKYDVSKVRPGLSGLAQINGRDELEIVDKAKYDGQYVKEQSFAMDVKCFAGSCDKVANDNSVVEGGTGSIKDFDKPNFTDGLTDEELIGNIGFGQPVNVDNSLKRKVLITGAGSYIGESFTSYAKEHYPDNFEIDTIDMLDGSWRNKDFSGYDIVYHVAGIAHADVGNVDAATIQKYYDVNTSLAVEVCKKAKVDGVNEFVFMSSMIVYGDSAPVGVKKVIDAYTVPCAANFYGDSKLQADVAVRQLATDSFKVVVLRPPMIYGKGSKGNFPMLVKLAKTLPVFPEVKNQRSMLYIENLCEFLCQMMLVNINQNATVLIPQNAEYSNTSQVIKLIADALGKNIHVGVGLLSLAVKGTSLLPGKVSDLSNKAFGNSCYSKDVSYYEGLNYDICDLQSSIRYTVFRKKKRVLFLVNHEIVIYNFRLELVERLLSEDYEVHISSPEGSRIDKLVAMGCIWHPINFNRHGKNPIDELLLMCQYEKLYIKVKPDVVLGFTIKPNIYGSIVASSFNIPYLANITGLGTAIENNNYQSNILMKIYRRSLSKSSYIFFQNKINMNDFVVSNLLKPKCVLLPGSGVNISHFRYIEYSYSSILRFYFVSRIMKEKGIEIFLTVAKKIKQKYSNIEFYVCGFCEEDYEEILKEYQDNGTIIYKGMVDNMISEYSDMSCLIHPSFHEGMSNVCLEAAASGRPIIASDIPGCREIFEEGKTGFGFKPKNENSLIEAIEKFVKLSHEEKRQMGIAGREKVKAEFDRNFVVSAYVNAIKDVTNKD